MKDSGVEWIGEIPEDWKACKIKYLAKLQSGDILSSEKIRDDSAYPVYGGNGLRGYTDAFTHSGSYILIGRQGALCGNVHVVNGNFWPSEHAIVSYELTELNQNWLAYILHAMNLNQYSTSAAQPGLAIEKIRDLFVCLPPLIEQHRIASFLDTKCSLIDSTIEKEREVIDKLKEYRQAVITESVTKGIRAGVPMKDSGVEWIGEIPEGWELMRLKLTVDLINEKTEYNGQTYIGLENIESVCGKYLETENQIIDGVSNSFSTGDILFGKLRPYLAKCIVAPCDGLCSSELLVIRNFKGNPQFLFWTLLSHWFINIVDASTYGAKMPRASWNFIRDLRICYPPLPEQQKIADYLDAKCSAIDATIQKRELAIEKLTAYKQSLIYECVTGKKEVFA